MRSITAIGPTGCRRRLFRAFGACALLGAGIFAAAAAAAQAQRVVDVPTRPGVSQRFLWLPAADAKAAAILFAGGHGGLAIDPSGKLGWGSGNFLVRTRALFAARGVSVAVIDAPSDRQAAPWLGGFRQTPEHAADVRAVVAWMRREAKVPVWLVGTSRGTQSAAALAIAGVGADGIVLTSSVLVDPRGRPVPAMAVERIGVPVLVVHHRDDACFASLFAHVPALVERLNGAPRKALVAFDGGKNVGDPCEAFAYHGYNGIEAQVVDAVVAFVLEK